jgi:hypothetical protein
MIARGVGQSLGPLAPGAKDGAKVHAGRAGMEPAPVATSVSWLGSRGRLGRVIIRISLPPLRVFRNPLNRIKFGNKTLDDFGFAIGP